MNGGLDSIGINSLMAHLLPHFWPNLADAEYASIAVDYRRRYRAVYPLGMPSIAFRSRGAYGHYFEHHANSAAEGRY